MCFSLDKFIIIESIHSRFHNLSKHFILLQNAKQFITFKFRTKNEIINLSIYQYTYKSMIILIDWLFVCMFEAVRTFENSRAKSTCYDS